MEKPKLLKRSLIALFSFFYVVGCSHPSGNVRIYSLDVDHKTLRNEKQSIPFEDGRLRCNATLGGRECRYLCMDSDDLTILINSIGQK